MQNLQEKYKYTPFLEYSDELESIISEKAYSTDIANMLRLSFPVMIEYYGHEYKNVLFNVLKEVNIEIPEDDKNMYDIVNFDYIVPIEVNKPFMSKNKILKLVNGTK